MQDPPTQPDSRCEILACADDRVVLENFVYGDTPSGQALKSLVEHLLLQGRTFDISRYDLSGTNDIRQLVVATALAYLELEGVIVSKGPFYAGYRFQWIASMEQVHRDFERVIHDGDNKALIAVDRKFHQQLYEASGNRFLARALEDMYTLIYRLFFFALDRMGSVRGNVQEHRDILEAIKDGNGRDAERLIQLHIAHFQRMVDELL